ncbi:hypothetical protein NL676_001038 [Syzygium grande]|nr:hypothetical protein NL676_001038 [Syzygium grande]
MPPSSSRAARCRFAPPFLGSVHLGGPVASDASGEALVPLTSAGGTPLLLHPVSLLPLSPSLFWRGNLSPKELHRPYCAIRHGSATSPGHQPSHFSLSAAGVPLPLSWAVESLNLSPPLGVPRRIARHRSLFRRGRIYLPLPSACWPPFQA